MVTQPGEDLSCKWSVLSECVWYILYCTRMLLQTYVHTQFLSYGHFLHQK